MRKSEDLPQPLGPTMRRWSPYLREKDRALTRTSPLGEIIGLQGQHVSGCRGAMTYTSMKVMSELSCTVPRPFRTASLSSVPAAETSFFSKCPD